MTFILLLGFSSLSAQFPHASETIHLSKCEIRNLVKEVVTVLKDKNLSKEEIVSLLQMRQHEKASFDISVVVYGTLGIALGVYVWLKILDYAIDDLGRIDI